MHGQVNVDTAPDLAGYGPRHGLRAAPAIGEGRFAGREGRVDAVARLGLVPCGGTPLDHRRRSQLRRPPG